jgi:tetrahydromethanopterin S-methyltransferase subunit G
MARAEVARLVNWLGGVLSDSNIQAALISAAVALSVLWLKDRFDRRAKREEWEQKRSEWLLDKQTRDVETLVLGLDKAIKEAEDDLRESESLYLNLFRLNRSSGISVAHLVDPQEFEELKHRVKATHRKIAADRQPSSIWLRHDAIRLTVWLTDYDDITSRLKRLEEGFNQLLSEIEGMTLKAEAVIENSFNDEGREVKSPMLEQQHNRWGRSNLDSWRMWEKLAQDVTKLQRDLVQTLRWQSL